MDRFIKLKQRVSHYKPDGFNKKNLTNLVNVFLEKDGKKDSRPAGSNSTVVDFPRIFPSDTVTPPHTHSLQLPMDFHDSGKRDRHFAFQMEDFMLDSGLNSTLNQNKVSKT